MVGNRALRHERDLGCGTGALLRTLADRLPAGVQLSGVDPAPAMLEVGRAALGERSQVRLARAVAEQLPLPDASFDLGTRLRPRPPATGRGRGRRPRLALLGVTAAPYRPGGTG